MFKKRIVFEVNQEYYILWEKMAKDYNCRSIQEFMKKFMNERWMEEQRNKIEQSLG